MKLEIGTKIYYSGDMANPDGFGEVIAIRPATKWSSEHFVILMDDERVKTVPESNFAKGPGQRFHFEEEWQAQRRAMIQQYLEKARA